MFDRHWKTSTVSATTQTIPSRLARGFTAVTTAASARLPFGIGEWLSPHLIGFAVINSATFALDLALLSGLHGALALPLWLAVTISYATAFAASFALNRTLNFRSHGPIGHQLLLYISAVAINYLAFILGVGAGLTNLGIDYRISRILAGACEAAWMYGAMRFLVFRRAS